MKAKASAGNEEGLTFTPRRGRRPDSPALRDATAVLYREHIKKAAEKVFAKRGFSDTKMQDIAAASGISLGTLYQSYPGKRDLYRELLLTRDEEMMSGVAARGQRVLKQPQSIEQMLWFQEAALKYLLEHDEYLTILLREGHAWYHHAAQPSSAEQNFWVRGEMAIKQVLVWGARQGVLVPGNTKDQARLLVAMQQTRLSNWVINGMSEALGYVVAAIEADFVRQFCVPDVAKKMLTNDGSRLTEETIKRIRAFDLT